MSKGEPIRKAIGPVQWINQSLPAGSSVAKAHQRSAAPPPDDDDDDPDSLSQLTRLSQPPLDGRPQSADQSTFRPSHARTISLLCAGQSGKIDRPFFCCTVAVSRRLDRSMSAIRQCLAPAPAATCMHPCTIPHAWPGQSNKYYHLFSRTQLIPYSVIHLFLCK